MYRTSMADAKPAATEPTTITTPASRGLARQLHRWLSLIFTLTVAGNFVALAIGKGAQPPAWVTYAPLLPLAVLMLTGLCLFVQPYLRKARRASSPG